MQGVKIFGMERTCTNLVREIANREGVNVITDFGYKHNKLSGSYPKDTLKTYLCVKDPYHWLISIRNYCIKEPSYGKYRPDKLLRRFNEMNLHWHKKLIERKHKFFTPAEIVRYEDLLRNPAYYEIRQIKFSDYFTDERRAYYLTPIEDKEVIKLVNRYVSKEFFIKYDYRQY